MYSTIKHFTTSYIDDSSHIISSKSVNDLKYYLHDLYVLLAAFYTINKLKINNNKTGFIVTAKKGS